MPKISHTSQIISDLYYQSYSTDESFFKIEHFRYIVSVFYNSILSGEYQKSKAENQAETGFIYPSISQDLIRKKEYTVADDDDFRYVEVDEVINFPFDVWSFGIAYVRCIKNTACGEFKRTTRSMVNIMCGSDIPHTNIIWFFQEGERVYFYSSSNIPDKVIVGSIPAIDSNDTDFIIPQSYETQIITSALNLFKQAAQGTVVDMSNDSNPNKVLQTEINQGLSKIRGN